MMMPAEPASVPSNQAGSLPDHLRLAVAAYLARFKGSSREDKPHAATRPPKLVADVQGQGGHMDIPAMFGRAVAEFDARVRQIGGHQWRAATPNEDWCVRDLVNHVTGEDLWAPPLLAGATIAEVGDRFEGDVLGSDPKEAWTVASAEAVRAVEADGAMDRIVHLSFGDFPGGEYTLQLFADHLIHAWDLARAIGSDEHLDEELVTSCAAWFDATEEAYRSAGVIAARPPVPGDADAQTLLLARFGRRA